MRHGVKLAIALGACASASGCATAAAGAAASVGLFAAQERTIGQGIDDSMAGATIKTRLIASDRAFQRVDINVVDGRALLTGSMPTMEHRMIAERTAWETAGITSVANEIVVGPRSGMLRSARDEVITTQVRARLVSSDAVRAIDFNIETHEGVVYLMGVARSDEEARLAAEAASRVGGVERVISYVVAREPKQGLRTIQAAEREGARVAVEEYAEAIAEGAAPAADSSPSYAGGGSNPPSVEGRGAPLFPR